MDEYIIINKTNLIKRIEELRLEISKLTCHPDDTSIERDYLMEIDVIEQILSQSTPIDESINIKE